MRFPAPVLLLSFSLCCVHGSLLVKLSLLVENLSLLYSARVAQVVDAACLGCGTCSSSLPSNSSIAIDRRQVLMHWCLGLLHLNRRRRLNVVIIQQVVQVENRVRGLLRERVWTTVDVLLFVHYRIVLSSLVDPWHEILVPERRIVVVCSFLFILRSHHHDIVKVVADNAGSILQSPVLVFTRIVGTTAQQVTKSAVVFIFPLAEFEYD